MAWLNQRFDPHAQDSMDYNIDSDSDDDIPILQDLDEDPIVPTGIPTIGRKNNGGGNADEIESAADKCSDLPPVPVTILTGFLGSGKTTLVRHILTSPQHQKRIAVIENEFGGGSKKDNAQLAERMGLTVNDVSTLSVETMIAKDGTDGSSLADFIELPNGCVCCTVKDSLVETLELLLTKRTDLDYVIIEASGMADPGPVASIFWLDDALGSRIRLDGIVTCVDAKNISFQLESTSSNGSIGSSSIIANHDTTLNSSEGGGGGDEAARQIAFADRIIVNKVDLLQQPLSPSPANNENSTTAITLDAVRQQIKSINPTAPMKTTMFSKVEDLNWILDANCFDAKRVKDVELAFQQLVDINTIKRMSSLGFNGGKCNNLSCRRDHSANDPMMCGQCSDAPSSLGANHQHTNAVGTIALFHRGSVDLHKMNSWLASILWPNQDESDKVLRAQLEEDLLSSREIIIKNDNAKNAYQSRNRKQTIYRAKGILSVGHAVDQMGIIIPESNDWVDDGLMAGFVSSSSGLDKRRYIVQAVNDLWDVLPASQNLCWDENETRCCKIVVIGKWLDEDQLQNGFQECFSK